MFIPWPKNMPCPVPSSHPTRYEWTLDATGLEDVTVPEKLVELVARTHGYVHHSSITPSDETANSATSTTSTSRGKTIDRGGKRASETNDHGGKRVSKVVIDKLANDARSEPSTIPHQLQGV